MLGIGESTFRREVAARRAPQPRQVTPNRVAWLYTELVEHASKLPVSGILPPVNTRRTPTPPTTE